MSAAIKDALLEIGSEELPASFIEPAMAQLKTLAEGSLREHRLGFGAVTAFGTPRRLAVLISGLADRSEDQEKTVTGPSAAASRDAQGNWTAAALGFARKHGLKPAELRIERERLCAILRLKGTAARPLLGALFPQWIAKLEFPKTMVWEPTRFRYPRPIRWLAGVFGGETVPFSLAGVRSGRWTYGLALHSGKKIAISSPAKYALLLKNQCVLADPAARREAIRRLAEQAVKRVHGTLLMPAALLDQVANLTEHPVAVLGNFDPAYLDLPTEVLTTCLEHHQKFFPVGAGGSKLMPHFVGIRNGMSVHQEIVREGYERVLAARLADARFFYEQDSLTSLADKQPALQGVTFQEKLGTLAEKTERILHLAVWTASRVPDNASWQPALRRAALLCKADLTTAMVGEFPELQGVMARLYALADGEETGVAQALEEHYWPVTPSGKLPTTDLAAAVALADKADTLAGDFSIGLIPSGSADPYGLRRAAAGVLRILEERRWPVPVEALFEEAFSRYPLEITTARPAARRELDLFLKQRFAALLEERGFRFDEVDAVLASGVGIVHETIARLRALHDLRSEKRFETLTVAFKRAMNIVRQAAKQGVAGAQPLEARAEAPQVRAELLQDAAEKALAEALDAAATEVSRHLDARAYPEALLAIAPLREPLDRFFAEVRVMVEDPALRANRLALMNRVVALVLQVADFSKLQA